MGIINTVEDVAVEFERITGRKPKYLYVGYEEAYAIKELRQNGCITGINIRGDRLECCGLLMFVVNTDTHLRVS